MLKNRQGHGSRRQQRDETVRLDEEITAFGELLTAHTFVPGQPGADADAVADYRRALDAYEQATRSLGAGRRRSGAGRRLLPSPGRPDNLGALRALDEGRHALACLDARLSGKPLPERLPLCFFDPRHGPSVSEHPWAPGGGAVRMIAVCAADAVRLSEGDGPAVGAPAHGAGPGSSPSTRTPAAGSRPVPQKRAAPVAAAPLRDAPVPGRKPRLRERYTGKQLALRGLLALLTVHAVALYATGGVDGLWGKPLDGIAGVLFASFLGTALGAVGCLFASATYSHLSVLWRTARRGERVRAPFVRRQTSKQGKHYHVFAVTDVTGRRHEYRRSVGGPAVAPLPYRKVWYVQGVVDSDNPLGILAPLWMALVTCVCAALTVVFAPFALFLIPGLLIRALF
ncbi:hypothetical protein B7C62_20190 [Kitasatospora albolonga]|uniref:Uncharacterized protein n=1 Tax=Kitasatospora albolonga TaxID=68173 RepID=A0ABC8BWW2_9ACTN|nr:hypothetical protein B7C62_20190 [Kitasatospora albolonga]